MSLKSYPLELHNMNMLLKNLVRMHNGSMPIPWTQKVELFSLPNKQGDIVLSCKSLIFNLLWCLVTKGTMAPFAVVK